jgi:signal peptidase I
MLRILCVIIVLITIIGIWYFYVSPYDQIEMNGKTMYPTIDDSEVVKYNTKYKWISKWDIVVMTTQYHQGKLYIKRVIWAPWDSVKIRDGKVYLRTNSNEGYVYLDEEYLDPRMRDSTYMKVTWMKEWLDDQDNIFNIPENSYFLLGDNRRASTDSRQCFQYCTGRSPFIEEGNILWVVESE